MTDRPSLLPCRCCGHACAAIAFIVIFVTALSWAVWMEL